MPIYEVTNNQQITPSTLLITLKSSEGHSFLFEPGQYAAINGFKGHRPMPIRCFSMVSSPTENEALQFSMRIKGKFTNALAKLKPGEKVNVQGPYGGFVLGQNQHKKIVMLAGGIGITPFISMIRYAAMLQTDTQIRLLYSVANQDDVPFFEEILAREKQNKNFSATFVVSDGPIDKLKGAKTASGRITVETIEKCAEVIYGDVSTVFYTCGPPPFMKGMIQGLKSRKVARSRIISEAFSQGSHHQTGKVRDWPYSMYALSALGLSAGFIAVMASDLIKLIPKNLTTEDNKQLTSANASSARENDLDKLVEELGGFSTGAPVSEATQAALDQAAANEAANAAATGTTYAKSSTSSSVTTSSSTSGSTSGTTTTTTAPAPAPTPTCTTTQSGVTVC